MTYIARTVQTGEYLLLVDGKIVAGPFAIASSGDLKWAAAEAVKARDELTNV